MMNLDEIKQGWKNLVGACQHERLFHDLLSALCDRDIQNRVIMVKARWVRSSQQSSMGVMSLEEKSVYFNQENFALLDLIHEIKHEHLSEPIQLKLKNHKSVPAYAVFCCDRSAQSATFDKIYYATAPTKINFFFLVGDARQAHISLPKRFGHQVASNYFDFDANHEDEPETDDIKSVLIKIKPQTFDAQQEQGDGEQQLEEKLKSRQIRLWREVFTKFGAIPPRGDLLNQDLAKLLRQSSKMKRLTAADSVFVLVTIDKALWDVALSPLVVLRFIKQFCQVKLSDDMPDFFFFFGIEYPPNEPDLKNEVKNALFVNLPFDNDPTLHIFDDLEPVPLYWVDEWLTRYDALNPDCLPTLELTAQLFPGKTPEQRLDMLDIEKKLQEIIDLHNKRHVLWLKNSK